MSLTELRYGDGALLLRKSEELAGLRHSRQPRASLRRVVATFGARDLESQLGPFALVQLTGASQAAEVTLNAVRNDPAVEVGTHVFHTDGSDEPLMPTGDIFLVVGEAARRRDVNRLLKRHGLLVRQILGPREMVAQTTRASASPVKVAAALQRTKTFSVAEPDFAVAVEYSQLVLPTDPLLQSQWHLRNTGSIHGSTNGLTRGADARVIDAWMRCGSLGSREVTVAVMDTGFDLSHPDLSGAGKIRAPWNFVLNNNDPRPTYELGYPRRVGTRWEGDWHGTACAGLAIGNADGSGVVGTAPGASFMPLKMDNDLSDVGVAAMFDHARVNGAAVVSCSWQHRNVTLPLSELKKRAIARCAREGRGGRGVVIVFAAGNKNRNINDQAGGYVNGYATHSDVIAVAASTSLDDRAGYSNFGREISVCAPAGAGGGLGITTSDVSGNFSTEGGQVAAGFVPGNSYSGFEGTSAAAPVVAGICALMLSVRPSLTAAQAKTILQESARKIPSLAAYDANGHSIHYGYGCVNADRAIQDILAL
jgi:hypothetical protein